MDGPSLLRTHIEVLYSVHVLDMYVYNLTVTYHGDVIRSTSEVQMYLHQRYRSTVMYRLEP